MFALPCRVRDRSGLARAAHVTVAAAVIGTAVAACNTTEGVGKDVKGVGKGIEETAQDAKND